MDLPPDLKGSFVGAEFESVVSWWESLTCEQQADLYCHDAVAFEVPDSRPVPDDTASEDELSSYYEYLTNHEWRVVNFVADAEAHSTYRVVSSYLALLGSDYRHGEFGTVR